MFWHFLNEKKYFLLTITAIIAFFIVKIPYLHLPFYWDEAWVYGPAVRKMAISGISLLPDALPIDLYRGHPQLFHVLNATWIKVFGNTLFSVHSFNLLVACVLVLTVYFFGKKFFTEPVGAAAAIILCLQPIFIAQSTLVLPEVMVGLFSLLALYFFIQNNIWLYILFATAASLTKETGIAVILTCSLIFLITGYNKSGSPKNYVLGLLKIAIPIIPLIIFILIQKHLYGWYLFPEHVDFISFDINDFWGKFKTRYITFTFLLQGRNLLFFAMIFAIVWRIYKKQKPEYGYVIVTLLVFILIYSLIGAFNFFTKRYVFSLIPVFIILSTGIIFTTFNKYILYAFLLAFSIAQIKYIRFESNSDHNLGFTNAIKANQSMIDYCLSNNMKEEDISVFFILGRIMTDPLAGYIDENEVFTKLTNQPSQTEYFIVSNYDTSEKFLNFRSQPEMVMLKRFEYKTAWIELYRNSNFP